MNIPLFDAMYREFSLRSDNQLAIFVGKDRASISNMRAGRVAIGDAMIAKIARKTGWSVERIDALIAQGEKA